ncbi:YdcF family protein [Rhodococcus sp. NPDC057135]|uniref:YdcF family protein n=1 Tax=Rhodococcus sp. NPDC057135 TaxID=3346028 RepID=UPI00362EF676
MGMSSTELDQLVAPLWEFLSPSVSADGLYDCIFVMGGADFEIPRKAAELWRKGHSPIVLITGGHGPFSGHFDRSEAEVFAEEMRKGGVPDSSIILEPHASNSGENVRLGMGALSSAGIPTHRIAVVSKPFIMRRCLATFAKQFPEVQVDPVPPIGSPSEFLDRDSASFVTRLVGEIERLRDYSGLGFTVPVEIPREVSECEVKIRATIAATEYGEHNDTP